MFTRRITYASFCLNALLIALSLILLLRCSSSERASRDEMYAEAAQQLHQSMLNLQKLKEGKTKPPEEFIRDLRETEAMILMAEVDSVARLVEARATGDESFVHLKEKLKTAREFIAGNPDLFSVKGTRTIAH